MAGASFSSVIAGSSVVAGRERSHAGPIQVFRREPALASSQRIFANIPAAPQPIGFFEVHAENYMGAGGPPHAQLGALRERYALSLHGVGLSIGSTQPLDRDHLARLKLLCDRYAPDSFFEHLAWSSHDGVYFNDLLPLPYSRRTLARVSEHIDTVQTALGREMLLENPSTYVAIAESTIAEVDFLAEVSKRTGCGLLLDVNNVFVSAHNQGTPALSYLESFPFERVREIHLGGHHQEIDDAGTSLLIDAHGTPVADAVWTLYRHVGGGAQRARTDFDRVGQRGSGLVDVARPGGGGGTHSCRRIARLGGVRGAMLAPFESSFAQALLDPERPVPRGISPARRFSVYRNNVVAGLVKALASRFPAVERIVGEEFFAAMARAFVVARPPRSAVLASYGEEFADFIAAFAPAREPRLSRGRRPDRGCAHARLSCRRRHAGEYGGVRGARCQCHRRSSGHAAPVGRNRPLGASDRHHLGDELRRASAFAYR